MGKKNDHCDYSQCPVACALDIIGDRWTLLVIRDLLFTGRHEYKDMLSSDEGISTNILADRLKQLQSRGIIASVPHPENKTRKLYYLTQPGKDLIHVMIQIAIWADKHLTGVVSIPTDTRDLLINNTGAMIQYTLQELEKWEKEFIV